MGQVEKLTAKRIVTSIGVLPSSYVESMSYYEAVMWLCNYLENTVIPTVNNNSEVTEELIGLYDDLKNFIETSLSDDHLQILVDEYLQRMLDTGTLYMSLKELYDSSTKELEFVVEAIPSVDILNRLSALATPEGGA